MSAKFALAAFTASCGDGGAPSDGGVEGATKDVSIDVIVDPQNCVAPNTPNNSQGVGGYCSPGGGQCASSGPGGSPRICTADLAGAIAHEWYCTYPCSQPSDCGNTATCIATQQGMMCVPSPACTPIIDAGADASDASSDASNDAPSDAPNDVAAD